MGMNYSRISEGILMEDSFDPERLGKCESIMSLGNGYMGLRSATEERYTDETRGLFVAGTFNKFDEGEVTELPNSADVTAIDLRINGERFLLTQGTLEKYSRELNVFTGELTRDIVWVSKAGVRVKLKFSRTVSLKKLHAIAQRVEITALDGDIEVKLSSGIDGRVTNTGSQHFSEGDKRFYDNREIQYVQTTTQSGIHFVTTTTHALYKNGAELPLSTQVYIDRRYVYAGYTETVEKGAVLTVEKYSTVYTSRDADCEGMDLKQIQETGLAACKAICKEGYEALLSESSAVWKEEVWDAAPISIEGIGENAALDRFAIYFAQYHMRVMVPAHDHRMNIGAKGLSGEGYKGHTFWDTEIFLLPYYAFTSPKTARSLEEYRYLSLPGAHEKAAKNGYKGAMFPWESAWLMDGEVTPEYCDVDILTGLPLKVWSGFIEQHVTADVAFGAWMYATVTGDEDFMDKYGYELIMDTAIFWASRLEKGADDGKYHINDVVGPDEFREHVNDNAFTNYMACWNMKKAVEYHDYLKEEKPELFEALRRKLTLDEAYPAWKDGIEHIYLPQPTAEGVLPQDDRYLSCQDIDLTKYKEQEHIGGIMRDYNLEQINKIQVSKQADVLVLFFLLEDMFPQEVKTASWEYYEKRTIHDSSLSLSTHSVLACDMGEKDMAYSLFRQASMIDLGPFMGSSNAGIHAASFGGTWQCVVYGFGGVRMLNGELRITPSLPEAWDKLSYTIWWKGQQLHVTITSDELQIENLTGKAAVALEAAGRRYEFEDRLSVKY